MELSIVVKRFKTKEDAMNAAKEFSKRYANPQIEECISQELDDRGHWSKTFGCFTVGPAKDNMDDFVYSAECDFLFEL